MALRFEALGSDCELYAVEPREPLAATAGWIHSLHARLTRFDSGSELSRFNAGTGQWVHISTELEALLRAALGAFEASGGLVHAGVLPALVAAGYDRTFAEVGPTATTMLATPVAPLPDLLDIAPGRARLAPGAGIDLGGLAKGWIADRAVERMGPNSLANCGGDLRAQGPGSSGEGWPVDFGGKTLALDGHGAATSGTTKRAWANGRHHLIDPRTGAPARTGLTEVSVLARSALEAEVLAKTALLLGREHAEHWLPARAMGWALS